MMLATICTFKPLLQTYFLSVGSVLTVSMLITTEKHSAQPRKVGNFWISGIKKISVEVHLHAFGAKAGLAFSFNLLKTNGL